MAAIKTQPMASTDTSPVRYKVTDAHGNGTTLGQRVQQVATPAMNNAPPVNVLVIRGGDGAVVVLTQQNAADLATAITNFGNTGVLS